MWRHAAAVFCCVLLWPWTAWAAGAVSGLDLFSGVWNLDMERSLRHAPSLGAAQNAFRGLRVTVDAAGKRLLMEWPEAEPRNCRVTEVRTEAGRVTLRLEGFEPALVLERTGQDGLRATDRGESLIFERVKDQ